MIHLYGHLARLPLIIPYNLRSQVCTTLSGPSTEGVHIPVSGSDARRTDFQVEVESFNSPAASPTQARGASINQDFNLPSLQAHNVPTNASGWSKSNLRQRMGFCSMEKVGPDCEVAIWFSQISTHLFQHAMIVPSIPPLIHFRHGWLGIHERRAE